MGRFCVVLLSMVLFCGCGSDTPPPGGGSVEDVTFAIPFTPYWGTDAMECGTTYTGAGTSAADIELVDFLMFVRDVELIRETGDSVPLTLVGDQT